MPKKSILIIEKTTTNKGLNQLLQKSFEEEFDLYYSEKLEEFLGNMPKLKPTIILIDYEVVKLTIENTLEYLKTNKLVQSVPLLFFVKKIDLPKLIEFEIDDFIFKPTNKHEVLFRIKSIIKKSQQKNEIEAKTNELKDFIKEKDKLNQMLTARDLALNKSAAVSIINKKGIILFINDKFCSSSKFSKHELIGKEYNTLLCKSQTALDHKNIWRHIYRGEIWRGEICSLTKQGNILWSDTSISPIYNEKDKIIKFFTVHFDITDRKNFEKELKEKDLSVTKSINYASRIQKALLPSKNYLEEIFNDNFIVYKPRDIVSGDFYWVKQISNFVVVAIADCTGHGVPGAFMSMLGVSILNEIVTFRNSKNPSQILNEMRLLIKKSLHQQDAVTDIDDGMDISVYSIEKNTNKMYYSGAQMSIYILRNNNLPQISGNNITKYEGVDYNLYQVEGDQMPIGLYYKEDLFQTIPLQLIDEDLIYGFSDGYCDQLGGAKYEKFSTKRFRKLLLENCSLNLQEQKLTIENAYNEWLSYNNRRQIDDILVLGIKI